LESLDVTSQLTATPTRELHKQNSLILVPLHSFQLFFMTAVLSHTASTIFGFIRSTYEYLTYASLCTCILPCSRNITVMVKSRPANTIPCSDTRVHSSYTVLRRLLCPFQYLGTSRYLGSVVFSCKSEDSERVFCASSLA
jgi:hypothetical protein